MSISERVRSCVLCPLSAKLDFGFKPVPGIGSPTAKILFVYDTLTHDDYLIQQPLTSRDGLFFDRLLWKAQLEREKMYITSLVKCYTPCLKDVTTNVVKTCGAWLDEQATALRPKAVILAGMRPILYYLKLKASKTTLKEITTKILTQDSTMIVPIPALVTLLNGSATAIDYHADRIRKAGEWASQQA